MTSLLDAPEPLESARRAEEHREFWRPERVRLLLLAESHVFTSPGDLERSVVRSPASTAAVPEGFVRLVYCLGYGENTVLDRPIVEPPNRGTPGFWRLFATCAEAAAGQDFTSTLGSHVPPHVRLATKLAILGRLRDAGIWLLDASPVALYRPERSKPPSSVIDRCVTLGYDLRVRHAVELAAAASIVCIGLGVHRTLETRLRALDAVVSAIPQPSAFLTAPARQAALHSLETTVREAIRD